jgi:LPS sulfotransferase NodH
MSGYVSARFDFTEETITQKIFVIASSYRSGSTLVGLSLWKDGRFGAPFEYLNFEKHMDYMMARLGSTDFDEYLQRLIPLRTSRNGVFGVKAHFHHFEAFVEKSKSWRDSVASAKFLYVNRSDKIAQAISMAKALQNNAWSSFSKTRKVPLFYSKDLIDDCLNEVMEQTRGWWGWFEARNIRPHIINYEEFVENPIENIRRVAEWFGVDLDVGEAINLPMSERQSDQTNFEWTERYLEESRSTKKIMHRQ